MVARQRAGGVERVHQTEPRLGAVGHRHRDRVVQLHDRRRGHRSQLGVQLHDPAPVRRGGVGRPNVAGRDRRLDLVRTRPAEARGGVERGETVGDRLGVPTSAVLVVERHEIAGGVDPRGPSRVVQQHHGEEPVGLRFVGHELREQAGQADALGAQHRPHQVGAAGGCVALVEQEVQHGEHGAEALGEQVRGRHTVRDRRVGDLALGPHDALCHRGLGDEEGPCHLRGGETGEGPQCEGHLGLHGERRMAAGEDQLEPVVLDAAVVTVERVVARSQHRRLLVLPGADRLAAEAVDRPVARGDHEPRPGVGRDPIAWPALQRDRERLLGRLPRRRPSRR